MTCPTCGSPRVFPSRLRGTLEKVRARLTDKQPYRCRQCGSRAWRIIEIVAPHPDVQPDDLRTGRRPGSISSTDLDPLDPSRPRRPSTPHAST